MPENKIIGPAKLIRQGNEAPALLNTESPAAQKGQGFRCKVGFLGLFGIIKLACDQGVDLFSEQMEKMKQ